MLRLMQVLLYTPDVARLREFYQGTVGLELMSASPNWTAFRTAGAMLALSPLTGEDTPRVELTFGTTDLEGLVHAMESHGVSPDGGVQSHGWGKTARFHDADDNTLTVNQLTQDVPAGNGLPLATAIVHTRDMASAKAFYHHALGLKLRSAEPGWVEFEAGDARVALRDRAAPNGRSIAIGFQVDGLMEWAEEARGRGLHFATAPTAEDWGLFSDTMDPDGHRVTFFEPAEPSAIEEDLATPFEDEGVPHVAGIRKPVKKGSKAASRLAIKPEYKQARDGKRKRPSATTQAVAKVRGMGPEHARLTPKKTGDEKKAKVKPAIGHLRKAGRAASKRKSAAAAKMSKGKPVKKASARKGRTTARGKTSAARGRRG
jgi:predicted enzyme related to lactoylglutathione lyase